jgi:hypothetical protein
MGTCFQRDLARRLWSRDQKVADSDHSSFLLGESCHHFANQNYAVGEFEMWIAGTRQIIALAPFPDANLHQAIINARTREVNLLILILYLTQKFYQFMYLHNWTQFILDFQLCWLTAAARLEM